MRKILERNRMRQRAEELQRVREESIAAETAKRKRRSRSRKVTAEQTFNRNLSKVKKEFVEVTMESPVGAGTGGRGAGSRFKSTGKNKFLKPIFNIDGVEFEFETDLMLKRGQFADDFTPPKGSFGSVKTSTGKLGLFLISSICICLMLAGPEPSFSLNFFKASSTPTFFTL